MRLKSVKKVVSFIIALSMIVTLVPSVFAASVSDFEDFPTGWSREAMSAAVENGLLYGKSDTIIAPQDDLTRAEMAAIINRSFGATVEANITSYVDVPADSWYYKEIAKAVNMQTLEGDSASIMRPEDSITREEVFTVIARALVLETDDYSSLNRFPDGSEVSDWAKKYIACLAAKGYVNGDHESMLNPHENVSREEFAQVMHNIIKTYYVTKGDYTTTGLASDLIRTGDVNLSNITIDGDLIIGDGVGYGSVTLTNVTIKGRLLCRGGEKAIKLVNTTVEDKVVVKDVNGIVHFENYRDEPVFSDILLITQATFLTRTSTIGGGGGGGGGGSSTYYTVKFYNGMVKDAKPVATKKVKKNKKFSSTGVELEDICESKVDKNYTWAGKGIYDGNYKHTVSPEYIYFNEKDGANQWEVFTEDTVLDAATVGSDKTLEVYYAYKNIAVYLNNIITADSLKIVTAQANYDSNSRAVESAIDLLINAYNQLTTGVGKSAIESKQDELFNTLSAKTAGIITPDRYIVDKDVSLKISEIIEYDDIVAAVETYIHDIIIEDGTEEEIEEIFSFEEDARLDQLMTEIHNSRAAGDMAALDRIAKEAIAELEDYEPYMSLLEAFANKDEFFTITKENVAFAIAVANDVEAFTYDMIKGELEEDGYGPIIELWGKEADGTDKFKAAFEQSQDNYVNGVRAVIDDIRGGLDEEDYTTSLSVPFPVAEIIKDKYNGYAAKMKSLLAGKEIYLYNENEYLQDFANINWFNVFISEEGGQYRINDFFAMYEAMVDSIILIDEAITWYGDPANYPASSYEKVKSELAADMTSYINSVINIIDDITSGQPIAGEYTINGLIESVEKLNGLAGALGDSSAAGYQDAINSLVETMTNILTDLGEGNLPGGTTLEDVNELCNRLKEAIANLEDEEYDLVNKEANSMIKSALTKVDAIFSQLDENGTIGELPVDKFINLFGSQLENIISIIANADLGGANINIDSKWMIDVLFGVDEDNRFTVDDVVVMAPASLKGSINNDFNSDEVFVVDYYEAASESGDASIKVQRTIN